jgi:hypothetical protein
MSYLQLLRLSGASLVVGAVVSVIATLYSALVFVGTDPSPYANNALWVPISLLGAVGTALLILGLPGMYARAMDAFGLLGLIGIVLIFLTGLMFGVFFNLVGAVLVPYLASHAPDVFKGNGPPSFFPFFIIGTIIELAGTVLLAVPFLRSRALPSWVGYVLIASAVGAVVGFFLTGPNGPNNTLTSLIGNAGALLLFVALGGIGYMVWQNPVPEDGQEAGALNTAT